MDNRPRLRLRREPSARGLRPRASTELSRAISPHRLPHTLATRLPNEEIPITSLQRLLGHEKLATVFIYARVHNETVRRDYERAQARLSPASSRADQSFNAPTQTVEPKPALAEANCV